VCLTTPHPIVLLGETGTGKELFTRAPARSRWKRLSDFPILSHGAWARKWRSPSAAANRLRSVSMRLYTSPPALVKRQNWCCFVGRSMPIDSFAGLLCVGYGSFQ